MATPPVNTVATELRAVEKRLVVWLDPAHIILLIVLAVTIFAGIYLYDSKRAAAAEGKQAVAEAVLKQAQADAVISAKQNADFQAQSKAHEDALNAANAALIAANKALAGAIASRNAQLVVQQGADAKLSPNEQSARWQSLVPAAKVVPTTEGFQVDATGGLATIQSLEALPVLTQNIKDLNAALDHDATVINNDAEKLATEHAAHIADLENDLKVLAASKAETADLKAQLDVAKKKNRRNILRAYAAGVVSGVVLRKLLGF